MVLAKITGWIPGVSGPSNVLIAEIKELAGRYQKRQMAFDRWFSLLNLEDALAQRNMESFVSNDPRTTWNMATFLLQPKPLVVTIVSDRGEAIPDSAKAAADVIQRYFVRLWEQIDVSDLDRGKSSWFWNYLGFLTATGWYALAYLMSKEGKPFVDYWNPATVFPEFSDDPEVGLLRLARVRHVSAVQAQRLIAKNRWIEIKGHLPLLPLEGHLWKKAADDTIWHGVIIHNNVVKPLTHVEGLTHIPVLVGAVGGIPAFTNQQLKDSDELSLLGQSILAPNEGVIRNYNKQQTFMQQLLRDTANPRWKVWNSNSSTPVIKDREELYRRGAMFELGPNQDIQAMTTPAIPMELTQLLFSLRNMLQRGGFSDLAFGNVLQEVSGVITAQAAEAALQLLKPFYDASVFSIAKVSNSWYQIYKANPALRPPEWPELTPEILEALEDTSLMANYTIKIPGDLANRISMAKSLNSRLELPIGQVIEMMLPEVRNVLEAVAKVEGERAKTHPTYQTVQLVLALEAAALRAQEAESPEMARLFTAAANNVKKSLDGQPTPEDKLGQVSAGPRSEAENLIPNMRLGNRGQ